MATRETMSNHERTNGQCQRHDESPSIHFHPLRMSQEHGQQRVLADD